MSFKETRDIVAQALKENAVTLSDTRAFHLADHIARRLHFKSEGYRTNAYETGKDAWGRPAGVPL